MNIIALPEKTEPVDEGRFLIELVFKPNENGLRLTPQLTQLLLAHIGEILREIVEEEKCLSNSNTMGE